MSAECENELPVGWIKTTLGEAFQWGSGGTPLRSRKDFYGGDVPWAIIGDLNDGPVAATASTITEAGLKASSAKWVTPGSVLLAMYGSIGKLGVASIPLTTNQAIAFTDPSPVQSKYLFYYLMHRRHDLTTEGKGGTQQNISQTVIKAFPFLLCPLPEQERIVAALENELTKLYAAVAGLERVQANLKRYRASVLQSAVEGRLVPTEAELARKEDRDYEPAEVLLDRILAERRHRWEGAELERLKAKGKPPADDNWKSKYKEPTPPAVEGLPALPEGWRYSSLESLFFNITDGDHQAPPRSDSGIPFLVIGNMRTGTVKYATARFVPAEYYESLDPLRRPKVGDVLYSVTGSFGIPAQVREDREFCIQRHIAILRPGEHLNAAFFARVLASDLVLRQAEEVATGTAQKTVPLKGLRGFVVPVPPAAEQRRILAEIDRLWSIATVIELSASVGEKRCNSLRQSILAWTFAGRLVAQDGNDEPADLLLRRIEESRPKKVRTSRGRNK